MKKLAAVAVTLLAMVAGMTWWATRPAHTPVPPLWQASSPAWTAALGGEGPVTAARLAQFNASSTGLEGATLQTARDAATAAALSALTSVPYGDSSFDPPAQGSTYRPTPRCTSANLLALSLLTQDYDDVTWAKAAVVYSGKCADSNFTRQSPGVEYVYLQRTGDQWHPRWSWQTPGAGQELSGTRTDPASLVAMGPCGVIDGEHWQARPRVAVAFDRLCKQAAKAGVTLVVSSAWRSRQEQQNLFNAAVDSYGSPARAAQFVAPADDTVCTSKHCTGLAVGVEPDLAATTWLAAASQCLAGRNVVPVPKAGCPAGTTPVSHAEAAGFAQPTVDLPGYLEYVLPAAPSADGKASADCAPYGEPAPAVIAAVFRCRLSQAGVSPTQSQKAVQDALVVARCASGLNPQALVFGGKYATTTKPGTNRTFPMGGLFALAPAEPQWQSGSIADPVAAANYAAKLWLADRSFSRFFCATGNDAQLATQPAIAQFGGPTGPEWATTW